MSKKTKVISKLNAPTTAPEYKPSLWLDLQDQDVSMLKGLKVGDQGEFVVRGKIVGLEQRQRTNEKGKEEKTGSIRLESYEIDLMGEEDNEFKEISED